MFTQSLIENLSQSTLDIPWGQFVVELDEHNEELLSAGSTI